MKAKQAEAVREVGEVVAVVCVLAEVEALCGTVQGFKANKQGFSALPWDKAADAVLGKGARGGHQKGYE